MRFTLDSNILVRAVTSPRAPALRLLDLVLESHTLVLSSFILDEVERVLLYPRIYSRYRITADEAIRFTRNLSEAAHLVEPTILKPVALSDPDDDAVLYTAAVGKADILCTRNTRHFSSPSVKIFCDEHAIGVTTDLGVLHELFAGSGAQESSLALRNEIRTPCCRQGQQSPIKSQ